MKGAHRVRQVCRNVKSGKCSTFASLRAGVLALQTPLLAGEIRIGPRLRSGGEARPY
jgi:hypothetical protein